jgi:hypothetical protein
VKKYITELLDFLDNRTVFRRGVLLFILYMTWYVTESMKEFAVTALSLHYDGLSIGGIIAAITAPFAAIIKYTFELYSDARNK